MRDLKSVAAPGKGGRWMTLRVRLLGGAFLLLLCVVYGRAVQLQVFDQDKLEGMARDQYVRSIEIPARRGDIFDRRGSPLAQSVEVDSIAVDPSMLPDVKEAAQVLAKKVHANPRELLERLQRGRRFAWVKRQATSAEVAAVKALNWPAIVFNKEPRRFYPQRELAAHVIGLSGTKGEGLEGLELAFNDELSGQTASLAATRDARGRKLLTNGTVDPLERQGASMTLTLDRHLQYVAEKALSKAVLDAKAMAGMVVALDPKTGELLALANYPPFNPNTPGDASNDHMRNRAALDTFEPGSTLKPFVIAAALDEGVVRPGDTFDCEKGAWRVGRHTIHDTHPYDRLDVTEILQVSSNICMGKIAQLLGRERMVKSYQDFGFAQRTGLALPGEGRGVIPFPRAEVSLVTQSFGQGLTATAVQIAAAFGALANGGLLMRPYLVSKVVDPDGVVLLENHPTPVRQVVSKASAKRVIAMLETVVGQKGTAPRARLEGYRVAGKTGTAQKVDPVAGGYSDKRIASFVGVLPAQDPRLVIAVVIDEPRTNVYGGVVAAPAFKEIATAAMTHMGVPPDGEAPRVEVANPPSEEKGVAAVTEEASEDVGSGNIRVPDVSGKAGREAIASLLAASLEPRVEGSGRVVSQSPPPGSRVVKGTRVTLEMDPRQ
ncbi:MAG: penicillin-binding protein [Myxococcaceae bacterium]